jgi:hypothetical protein
VERARDAGETSLTLEQVAHRANEWSQQLAEKFRTLLSPEQGSSSPTIAKLTPTPKPGTRKTLPTTRATETPARQPQAYNPDHSVARSDAFKLMRRMAPKKADDE